MKHSLKTCLTGIAAAAFLPMALAGGGTGYGQPGGGTLKNPNAEDESRVWICHATPNNKPDAVMSVPLKSLRGHLVHGDAIFIDQPEGTDEVAIAELVAELTGDPKFPRFPYEILVEEFTAEDCWDGAMLPPPPPPPEPPFGPE